MTALLRVAGSTFVGPCAWSAVSVVAVVLSEVTAAAWDDQALRAASRYIAAMASFALKAGMLECFIDSIPALVRLYQRIGFEPAGENFFHYENGPSVPMVMDLTRHAERLSRGVGR